MSDIGLRLDGLLLGMTVLAGGGLFLLIAIVSAVATLMTKRTDSGAWTVARYSAYLSLAHVMGFAILFVLVDHIRAPTGPDWIDWLAIPWGCFILYGLILLVRWRRTR